MVLLLLVIFNIVVVGDGAALHAGPLRDVELLLMKLGGMDRDSFESAVQQHEADEERRAEERKVQREAEANKKRARAARGNNNAASAAIVRCTRCRSADNSKRSLPEVYSPLHLVAESGRHGTVSKAPSFIMTTKRGDMTTKWSVSSAGQKRCTCRAEMLMHAF